MRVLMVIFANILLQVDTPNLEGCSDGRNSCPDEPHPGRLPGLEGVARGHREGLPPTREEGEEGQEPGHKIPWCQGW